MRTMAVRGALFNRLNIHTNKHETTMLLPLISGLIIGALAVIFALQNIFPVTVTFLTWHVTSSLAVLITLAGIAGIAISVLLSLPEVMKNAFTLSELRKENKKLRDEADAAHQAAHHASLNAVHPETPLAPSETEGWI